MKWTKAIKVIRSACELRQPMDISIFLTLEKYPLRSADLILDLCDVLESLDENLNCEEENA